MENALKNIISPPGDTIQETIDEIGMTQKELAERLGRSKEKLNDMIKGREPISMDTAYRLEKVLGIPASFWMNREEEYRKNIYEFEQEQQYKENANWAKKFPIKEMIKNKWISEEGNEVENLLNFFGLASPAEWKNIYLKQSYSAAFRISLAQTKNPYAISVWLRKAELEAMRVNAPKYDKVKFKKNLLKAKELSYEFPKDTLIKLKELCRESGVKLIYLPNLPKAPINGATRWFKGNPLIIMTDRYKTNDIFWFTFFHEAGHIILHGKKDIFLEEMNTNDEKDKKEIEADEFAENYLISKNEMDELKSIVEFYDQDIEAFSKMYKIHPGILVGRLQKEKLIKFNRGNKYKEKVEFK